MPVLPTSSCESLGRGRAVGEPMQAPLVVPEVSAPPSGQTQRRVTFDSASSTVGSEEVEDDDDDSVVATHVDKSLIRLSKFIYDQYHESRPLSSPPFPLRCGFESLFSLADPLELSRPRFRLYPRVREVMNDTRDRAVTLSHKLKPMSTVLPKKNWKHTVADELEFSTALAVNLDLFRQNTYLQNKKHTLTCQGGTGCYRLNYQPSS